MCAPGVRIVSASRDVVHVHLAAFGRLRVRLKAGQNLNLTNGPAASAATARWQNSGRERQAAAYIRHCRAAYISRLRLQPNEARADHLKSEMPWAIIHCAPATSRSVSAARPLRAIASIIADALAKGTGAHDAVMGRASAQSGLYSDLPLRWQARHPSASIARAGISRRKRSPASAEAWMHPAVLEDLHSLALRRLMPAGAGADPGGDARFHGRRAARVRVFAEAFDQPAIRRQPARKPFN